MLFMEPSPTRFDLRFRLLGVDVCIHPMFWLVSLLMGANLLRSGFQYLLIWVACVFVSILIHEMGHVAMGQVFGTRGHIVLYGFGGLAIGSNLLDVRWQRMAVCFAGPLAGFVFLGVVFAGLYAWDADGFSFYVFLAELDLGLPMDRVPHLARPRWPEPLFLFTISSLIFINLTWGLVNLFPIWPLDGGQISRDVCEGVSADRGLTWSLGISMVVAGLLAIHCLLVATGRQLVPLRMGSGYAALLFALLAYGSFQLLQQARQRQAWHDDHWYDRDDRYR